MAVVCARRGDVVKVLEIGLEADIARMSCGTLMRGARKSRGAPLSARRGASAMNVRGNEVHDVARTQYRLKDCDAMVGKGAE